MSSPSRVRGKALKALALALFLEDKIQHLINIPAPNLLKLTSRKRDIHERKYVKWGMMTLTQYYTISWASARWKRGGGHGSPWIFIHFVLNLPNFKNLPFLEVNTGSIVIGPLLKIFQPTPLYNIMTFILQFQIFY